MRVRGWSKAGVPAVCVVLTAGTAACSSSGKAAQAPAQAIETAYTSTVGQKTADFKFTETLQEQSSSGSAVNGTVNGSGQLNFSTDAFTMTIDSPSGGTLNVLETAGIIYVQVPTSEESQNSGKPWASINLNQLSQAKLGKSLSQVSEVGSDSPTQILSELESVSDQITPAGTATVDGVTTTAYKAQVDLGKVASQVQAKEGATAAQAITEEEQALGTDTIPVEVWIDAEHRVRQLQTEVPIPSTGSGTPTGHGNASFVLTFTSFGGAVNLTAPPSSQVNNVTAQAESSS